MYCKKPVACSTKFKFGCIVGLAPAAISRAAQFHNFIFKIRFWVLHKNVNHIFLHKRKSFYGIFFLSRGTKIKFQFVTRRDAAHLLFLYFRIIARYYNFRKFDPYQNAPLLGRSTLLSHMCCKLLYRFPWMYPLFFCMFLVEKMFIEYCRFCLKLFWPVSWALIADEVKEHRDRRNYQGLWSPGLSFHLLWSVHLFLHLSDEKADGEIWLPPPQLKYRCFPQGKVVFRYFRWDHMGSVFLPLLLSHFSLKLLPNLPWILDGGRGTG